MRREDAVLGVVVRLALRDEPVVRAEEEDAVAVEAVDREAAHDGAVDPQTRVGEAGRAAVTRLGNGDALILPARVLDDDGVLARREPHERDAIRGDDDRAGLPGLGRTRPTGLVVGPGSDRDGIARPRVVHRGQNRDAWGAADGT